MFGLQLVEQVGRLGDMALLEELWVLRFQKGRLCSVISFSFPHGVASTLSYFFSTIPGWLLSRSLFHDVTDSPSETENKPLITMRYFLL